MLNLLTTVLVYALLPAVLMIAGGIYSVFRPPQAALRSGILHFAAGLVFAVVAVELLPDMTRGHAPVPVVIGFVLGVSVMLLISHFTEGRDAVGRGAPGLPLGMLLPIAVDLVIDGLLLGIGFAAGGKAGPLLSLALAVELLSLGLALTTTLTQAGAPRGRALGVIAALAGLFAVVGVLGATLLQGLGEGPLAVLLSFGSAALLFLVTEELLVEAHEEQHTTLLTAAFFAGFLLFLVLGMLA